MWKSFSDSSESCESLEVRDHVENPTACTGSSLDRILIYFQNVRGLRTRSDDLLRNVYTGNYEIISLCGVS